MVEEIEKIYFPTVESWGKWLKDNHVPKNKVAVIRYKKHTGKPSPSHLELMHEAICWGWIDTTVKRIDEEKYMINFSKRGKNSRWSENTLNYAKKMIKDGRMSKEGMNHYKYGLTRPLVSAGIPDNPDMPSELKKALGKNKTARENYTKFPPSAKRMHFRWVLGAKTKETIMKRVNKIVELAEKNEKRIF